MWGLQDDFVILQGARFLPAAFRACPQHVIPSWRFRLATQAQAVMSASRLRGRTKKGRPHPLKRFPEVLFILLMYENIQTCEEFLCVYWSQTVDHSWEAESQRIGLMLQRMAVFHLVLYISIKEVGGLQEIHW